MKQTILIALIVPAILAACKTLPTQKAQSELRDLSPDPERLRLLSGYDPFADKAYPVCVASTRDGVESFELSIDGKIQFNRRLNANTPAIEDVFTALGPSIQGGELVLPKDAKKEDFKWQIILKAAWWNNPAYKTRTVLLSEYLFGSSDSLFQTLNRGSKNDTRGLLATVVNPFSNLIIFQSSWFREERGHTTTNLRLLKPDLFSAPPLGTSPFKALVSTCGDNVVARKRIGVRMISLIDFPSSVAAPASLTWDEMKKLDTTGAGRTKVLVRTRGGAMVRNTPDTITELEQINTGWKSWSPSGTNTYESEVSAVLHPYMGRMGFDARGDVGSVDQSVRDIGDNNVITGWLRHAINAYSQLREWDVAINSVLSDPDSFIKGDKPLDESAITASRELLNRVKIQMNKITPIIEKCIDNRLSSGRESCEAVELYVKNTELGALFDDGFTWFQSLKQK